MCPLARTRSRIRRKCSTRLRGLVAGNLALRAFEILAHLIHEQMTVRHQVLVIAPDPLAQDVDMRPFSAHLRETWQKGRRSRNADDFQATLPAVRALAAGLDAAD